MFSPWVEASAVFSLCEQNLGRVYYYWGMNMPKRGRGIVVGRAELAEIFGVSAPTVDDWVSRGCPYQKKGSKGIPWGFKSSEVYNWLKKVNLSVASSAANCNEQQLKLRKLAAETIAAELHLAKIKNDVAPVDDMKRLVAKAFLDVKARLRIVPERVSVKLIGMHNETDIKRVLLNEIDKTLTSLGDPSTWTF